MTKVVPTELSYNFYLDATSGTKYIDCAQLASAVNRRLYEQGKRYYVSSVEFLAQAGGSVALLTLPDTWVTANAHTKAKALWKQMNDKVLEDSPSVQGKWADFKVFFDAAHRSGGSGTSGPTDNLIPVSGEVLTGLTPAAEPLTMGEWNMSKFVQPQHSVDGSGDPLAADEYTGHMLGDNLAGTGKPDIIKSAGIIQGYADSRAKVQAEPSVPGDLSTSWMTLLTDDGSQEPELADVIEAANDEAPYSMTEYQGGGANFNEGVMSAFAASTTTLVEGRASGFAVPLGLIKVKWQLVSGTALMKVNLMPGEYKGLMATEMRQ